MNLRPRSTLAAYLALSRPIFLLGGLLAYALGGVVALSRHGPLRYDLYLLGQGVVSMMQLATHFLNEYFDVECDRRNRARTLFSGGSGVIVERRLPRSAALLGAAGAGSLALAVLAALVAVRDGLPPQAWALLALMALGAVFYSSPPLRLEASGWGELSASILVAVLVPLFAFVIQTGQVDAHLLLACAPSFFLLMAMMLAIDWPDLPADEASGKRTLAVRIGMRPMARLHNGFLGLALVSLALEGLWLRAWVAAPIALGAPLALWQWLRMRRLAAGHAISNWFLTFDGALLFAWVTAVQAATIFIAGAPRARIP